MVDQTGEELEKMVGGWQLDMGRMTGGLLGMEKGMALSHGDGWLQAATRDTGGEAASTVDRKKASMKADM